MGRKDLARKLGHDISHLDHLARSIARLYSERKLPKRDGTFRVIHPPSKSLKDVQKAFLRKFLDPIGLPDCVHGGRKKHDIFTFATPHVRRGMVVHLDIKQFFPSVHHTRVLGVMRHFLNMDEDAASLATRLTTYDNALPQGAQTSCALANLAFAAPDRDLQTLCQRKGLPYTRYVDDMAISGDADIAALLPEFTGIIARNGFQVNHDKVCVMPRTAPQVIVGLQVNDRITPTEEWKRQLDHTLQECLEHGPSACNDELHPDFRAHLNGKVDFAVQADREFGRAMRALFKRIDWTR